MGAAVLGRIELTRHQSAVHDGEPGDAPRPNGSAAVSLSPRMCELLVLLAAYPAGLPRESVVEALWPDSGRGRPANNLASLISRLRAALRATAAAASPSGAEADTTATTSTATTSTTEPTAAARARRSTDESTEDLIVIKGDTYVLDDTAVAVDLWTFLPDAETARHLDPQLNPRQVAVLERAFRLYRGPFGDGIDNAELVQHQVYCRRGFLDVTARLVRHYIHTDPTRAWAVLERCRNFEPLNEHVYADIIALQMKSGNNQGAQRTWELLVSHLAEIGQTPSSATAALLRGDTSANTSDVTP